MTVGQNSETHAPLPRRTWEQWEEGDLVGESLSSAFICENWHHS